MLNLKFVLRTLFKTPLVTIVAIVLGALPGLTDVSASTVALLSGSNWGRGAHATFTPLSFSVAALLT